VRIPAMTTIPDTPTSHGENAQAVRSEMQRLVNGIPDDFLRRMMLLIDAHAEIATSAECCKLCGRLGTDPTVDRDTFLGRKCLSSS
jgi:hypothetical protein